MFKMRKLKYLCLLMSLIFCFTFVLQGAAAPVWAAERQLADIAGLQLHLDAQSLEGYSDGQKVGKVSNSASSTLEGVGDAVQNAEANKPTYVAGSSINGKPALRFDAQSYMKIGGDNGFYLEDMTIFMVANFALVTSGTSDVFARLATGEPWNHNWYFNIESGSFNFGWYTGAYHAQAKSVINANTSYVLSARKSDNVATQYINGMVVNSFVGASPVDINTPVYLGGTGGASFNGDIGELIVFNRGLTDSEISTVEKYLEEKWGMAGIHDAQLAGLQAEGKDLVGFRGDKYNYVYLAEKQLTEKDFSYLLWNDGDSVTTSFVDDTFTVTVTGNGKTNTYKVYTDYMKYQFNEIQQLNANEVALNDGFWSDKYQQYSTVTLTHMYDMFDMSKSFDNFDRVANGEKKLLGNTSPNAGKVLRPDNDRDVYNTTWTWIEEPWREGLIYEGIRATGEFVMINSSKPEFREDMETIVARVNGYIERIYNAALKTTCDDINGKPIDGFFSTYNILTQTKTLDETDVTARWHHNVYVFGCLTEAAVYWYNATGDTRLLFAATRFAEFLVDYINGRDGFEGYQVMPAHSLSEEALQSMYELYKNNPDLVKRMEEEYSCVEGLDPTDRYYNLEIRVDEYAEIVNSWITGRGHSEDRYNQTNFGTYAQDNLPYDQIYEATGHAVRANLWYNALALLGNRYENISYLKAAHTIWDNIVNSQMYVTGGTGATHGEEAYGGTNQLPHDGYCETCASVGMAFFSQNMFNVFGESKYADNVELEMYNSILGCLDTDGTGFYYTNPMVSDDYTRPMFSNVTPCCIPMFLKYYSEMPEIIYAKTEEVLFVNQYIASSAQTSVGLNGVTIVQDTDMPNGNMATFRITTAGTFTLKLRVPNWASDYVVKVNGATLDATKGSDGYVDVTIKAGTTNVTIEFGKEVMRLHQDYAVANQGMVAIQYGPFVYCAEEVDNTAEGLGYFVDKISIDQNAPFEVIYDDTTFALTLADGSKIPVGVNILTVNVDVRGQELTLKLVPFYIRGNRTPGKMDVWFNELKY